MGASCEWSTDLLRRLPGFGSLSAAVLAALTARLETVRCASGSAVVREGEIGDRLYLIVSGQAEVSVQKPSGSVPLALLQDGDWFGEIALLSGAHRREATVTALNALELVALPQSAFDEAMAGQPQLRQAWDAAAEEMLRIKFLKQASPFAHLPLTAARALASRLEVCSLPAGATILQAGQPGQECYVIRRGEAAVILDAEGTAERELARLGPGALFGEMALLGDAPRSATVRATADCELLRLDRADLLAAMAADQVVGLHIAELFRFRDRPRQAKGIMLFEQRTADGQAMFVLKNPDRHSYHRLSEDGRALWELLDGHHSVRDLIVEELRRTKRLAPSTVVRLLEGLAAAGMLETQAFTHATTAALAPTMRWRQWLAMGTHLLHWQVSVTGCDAWIDRSWRAGVRYLFAPAALTAMAVAALGGLVAFIFELHAGRVALVPPAIGDWPLVFLIVANIAAIALHEASHAFATKYYGREVDRIGIGWYWLGPIAFVDTSDMWLGTRRARIAVNLAGILANLVFAGLAALIALAMGGGLWAVVLWQFVAISYALVLLNLNPLLEYDGYYVLSDWLDRPNLRRQSLAWLASKLPGALRQPRELQRHWLELGYGLASVAYLVAAAALTVVAYRIFFESSVAGWLTPSAAAAIAWLPAVLLAVTAAIEVAAARHLAR